jgi:hypothetical protein
MNTITGLSHGTREFIVSISNLLSVLITLPSKFIFGETAMDNITKIVIRIMAEMINLFNYEYYRHN